MTQRNLLCPDTTDLLSRLQQSITLNEDNLNHIAQIMSYDPGCARIFLDALHVQFHHNPDLYKKNLDRWTRLFVENKNKAQLIIKAMLLQPQRVTVPITLANIQTLITETAENLIEINAVLILEPTLKFTRHDAFQKILDNTSAIAKSIKNLHPFNQRIGVETHILNHPYLTQLDDFKVIADYLAAAGLLTDDNLNTIFNIPYPEATIIAMATYIKEKIPGLEKSSLIKSFLTFSPQATEYKKLILDLAPHSMEKAESRPGFIDPFRANRNQTLFNKLITLFTKANRYQTPINHKYVISGLVTTFEKANNDSPHKTCIDTLLDQKCISSFLSSKYSAVEKIDKIQYGFNRIKVHLIKNNVLHKKSATKLTLEETILNHIIIMENEIALLETTNFHKPTLKQKSPVEMAEDKIPIIDKCLTDLTTDINRIYEAAPLGFYGGNLQRHCDLYFDFFEKTVIIYITELKEIITKTREDSPKIIDEKKFDAQKQKELNYVASLKKQMASTPTEVLSKPASPVTVVTQPLITTLFSPITVESPVTQIKDCKSSPTLNKMA